MFEIRNTDAHAQGESQVQTDDKCIEYIYLQMR